MFNTNSTLSSQVQNPTSIANGSTAHYQASTTEQSDRSRRYTQYGSLALFGQDLSGFDKSFEHLIQISTLFRPLENGHGHNDSQTREGPKNHKNHRPISLIKSMGKVLKIQVLINHKKTLSPFIRPEQLDFCPQHSATNQLTQVVDHLTNATY
ncbi:unnamed protein product [Macrosiphum euphorbiae]|uniref:Uncharacterized protein n=1 Tax=Macrosiphum euphorbiae TaxID=13131 RepID=A0AAV0X400_9HEMI|nr:unnamed protein product [Macrosiphum euphorbiae]